MTSFTTLYLLFFIIYFFRLTSKFRYRSTTKEDNADNEDNADRNTNGANANRNNTGATDNRNTDGANTGAAKKDNLILLALMEKLINNCLSDIMYEKNENVVNYAQLVVIIVKILFFYSFFFYCLLYNHSFQTNPNSVY